MRDSSMSDEKYFIGVATIPHPENGLPARLKVVYFPKRLGAKASDPDDPRILVELWQSGTSTGPTRSPRQVLEFRHHIHHVEVVNGVCRETFEEEPPGWFERQCALAYCEWFVPLVRRMAAGEAVPLAEIQAAYRAHNDGKELPAGTLGTPFY